MLLTIEKEPESRQRERAQLGQQLEDLARNALVLGIVRGMAAREMEVDAPQRRQVLQWEHDVEEIPVDVHGGQLHVRVPAEVEDELLDRRQGLRFYEGHEECSEDCAPRPTYAIDGHSDLEAPAIKACVLNALSNSQSH